MCSQRYKKKKCSALDFHIISDTNPCAQEGALFFCVRHERPTANYSAMDAHDDVMTGKKRRRFLMPILAIRKWCTGSYMRWNTDPAAIKPASEYILQKMRYKGPVASQPLTDSPLFV